MYKLTLIIFLGFVFFFRNILIFAQAHNVNPKKTIYVTKQSWHTAIIISREEASIFLTRLKNEFTQYRFLEISWGDAEFFTAENPTFLQGFKAIMYPTKSVLLVDAFNESPHKIYQKESLIKICLSEKSFIELIKYLNNSFAFNEDEKRPIPYIKYSPSRCYFLSNEKYHLFKTCNIWTAKALKQSGIHVKPAFSIFPNMLFYQLKKFSNLTECKTINYNHSKNLH